MSYAIPGSRKELYMHIAKCLESTLRSYVVLDFKHITYWRGQKSGDNAHGEVHLKGSGGEEAWPSGTQAMFFFAFCCCDKHQDQRQLGEGRGLLYTSNEQGITEDSQGRCLGGSWAATVEESLLHSLCWTSFLFQARTPRWRVSSRSRAWSTGLWQALPFPYSLFLANKQKQNRETKTL